MTTRNGRRHPSARMFAIPAALLTVAAAASPAFAGAPRTHDGFLLRLSAGVGSAESENDPESLPGLKFSGFSGDYNFAVGGMVSENLALHGTLFGWSISDPDVEFLDQTGTVSDETLTMTGLGGGITYYAMPANIYLSPSVGLGFLSLDDEETDAGFAFDATIGKEWWVGGSWGLGLAGSVGYHSIPQDGVDSNWEGPSFGLRFSATLN